MSTRSAVGRPDGDKFKGRYIHGGGYPTYQAVQIWAIVKRDGVEKALKTLCDDRYGWSSLDHEMPADAKLPDYMADGRFVNVEGYGVAYTTEEGQSSPDQWVHDCDLFIEWAYVLSASGMAILKSYPTGEYLPPTGTGYAEPVFSSFVVGTYAWAEDEPDWAAVEVEADSRYAAKALGAG